MPNAPSPRVLSRMSWFYNTMFYDSVCLNGPHGQLVRVLVAECDDFNIVTSQVWRRSHATSSMMSPIDTLYALSYSLPIGYKRLNRLVSEIFSSKVADRHTYTQTRRPTIKVTLRLAAHKPTVPQHLSDALKQALHTSQNSLQLDFNIFTARPNCPWVPSLGRTCFCRGASWLSAVVPVYGWVTCTEWRVHLSVEFT